MSISTRYRDLIAEVEDMQQRMARAEDLERHAVRLGRAAEILAELREGVGEIPQMHLERQLTPVLLKAHNRIDRIRVDLEDQEVADWPGRLWSLQQAIYRLLNDL
ncbi:MAG: hypothetical protein Tsb0017_15340 [Geothermobacteraceae bacterium]|nr:MAG: hypothetical protein D6751_02150 [Deltaproteobacteria bacterium]